MIVIAPTETWPSAVPPISMLARLRITKVGVPAPLSFPQVLNMGIDRYVRTRGEMPTHALLGPDAWDRFVEFFEFSRVTRERKSEDIELEQVMRPDHVNTVNGVILVKTVEEGFVLLGDPGEA